VVKGNKMACLRGFEPPTFGSGVPDSRVVRTVDFGRLANEVS
jgi:hypothetical protein